MIEEIYLHERPSANQSTDASPPPVPTTGRCIDDSTIQDGWAKEGRFLPETEVESNDREMHVRPNRIDVPVEGVKRSVC